MINRTIKNKKTMSDYKLNFRLKQHTPIIHFQHDQEGATLRASELKPKLDRFLIEKSFGGILNFEKYKKLLLGNTNRIENGLDKIVKDSTINDKDKARKDFLKKQKLAFDYKVKITNNDENPRTGDVIIMPPKRENWTLSKNIFFELITFHVDLKTEVKKVINLFFCTTNFGKRQSKGFGCFYPESLSEKEFIDKIKKSNITIYKSTQSLRDNIQTSSYFYDKIILKKWNELKSGLNLPGHSYKKSEIFKYLEDENLRWGKRWIKRNVKELIDIDNDVLSENLLQSHDPIDIRNSNSWDYISDEEYRFGRALLGLAEHYEYQTTNENVRYKVIVLHNEIKRFRSPVIFKVFNNSIYAITEDIPSEIFDTPFTFEVQKKIKRNGEFLDYGTAIPIPDNLRTPSKSEFNLVGFLDSHFQSVGFKKL